MKKEISVATVAKRMKKLLSTCTEQMHDIVSTEETASTSSRQAYSTAKGLEKAILNYAAMDSDSDTNSFDQSYSVCESPPPRRRSIRIRKRIGAKTTEPIKRKQRKVNRTTHSKKLAEESDNDAPAINSNSKTEELEPAQADQASRSFCEKLNH